MRGSPQELEQKGVLLPQPASPQRELLSGCQVCGGLYTQIASQIFPVNSGT